ncbi:MAG: hypothetical protein ACR2MY_07240 [Candidatus Dormibacteria bacterium]
MTALSVRRLFAPHIFIGLLLLPPVALKMGSTGYRFLKYYTRNRDYLRAGPPTWLPRLLAPVVVLSTGALLGTGVILWALGGPAQEPWLPLHKASFVVWGGSTGLHVLLRLRQTMVDGLAEVKARGGASRTRTALATAAVLAGVLIGIGGIVWGPTRDANTFEGPGSQTTGDHG